MKQFKGRVVTPGEVTAEAVVTKNGFNTLASLQMALRHPARLPAPPLVCAVPAGGPGAGL